MAEGQMPTGPTIRRPRRRWISFALIALVLIGGGVGSLAAFTAVREMEQRVAEQMMDQNAKTITLAVRNETDLYYQTLVDLAASGGAQSNFTYQDFMAITLHLERNRLPGASGVAFIVPAGTDEIPAVQARWRARGATGLQLAPVGERAEHTFVVFSHSLDNAPANPGRDLSQAPEALEALQQARATGELAASRTYVLLKDRKLPAAQRQLSFTLAAPVIGSPGTPEAGKFQGWMLLGMRGGDFIDETLRAQAGTGIRITLRDLSGTEPRTVTFTPNPARSRTGTLERSTTVTFGQRTWQLQIQPTDLLLNASDRSLPMLAGLGGVLLTVVMALLVDARRRALGKVDRTTAALRQDIEQRKTVETRLRQSEYELRHLALHDPLTGLANRTLFYERLEHAMATHNRTAGTLAVLFIDLDGFKTINDELGHSAGDSVLTQAALRMRQCARDSDTVGRFGGDEFAILTEMLVEPEDVQIVADRVVRAMQVPFEIEGRPVTISCSVGIALHRGGDQLADDLLHSADEAMYAAKAAGKDRYILAAAIPL